MKNTTFLDKIASVLVTDYGHDLTNTIVILPNKRAKIFLIEALKSQIENTVFAPEIVSIEDFVQDIAAIRSVDAIEMLFEFYEVYLKITLPKDQQDFELFANWGKTLLQDFNEIDRYLLEPNKVLKYLDEIKEIEHWSVDAEKRTELIEKHLAFWKLLPLYYESLYAHLIEKKIGYQGLIYREATKKLDAFAKKTNGKNFLFAGFNALNAAEEKIVQQLLVGGQAKIYWDVDQVFLNDPYHDAALFVRRFKQSWPYYKSNPFEWIVDEFSQSKNISIIGTPKTIGQAKIAGSIIEKIITENQELSLDKVAIVLGDENLLLPVLNALPDSVGALNITMGYSSKNNPAQILIAKLFKMHSNAIARNAKDYVFYYKDVLDILTHSLIEPYSDSKYLVETINKNNITFITYNKIKSLQGIQNELFGLLFQKWEDGAIAVLDNIQNLLQMIKTNLNQSVTDEKLATAFVFSIFKIINKLQNYYVNRPHLDKIDTLYAIYKQLIDLAEVSFEGEPLNGLQIMGVLESRVLDFETVIVTAMNEGKFPAGKSSNSFIPYDVKRELKLPTFKEKDAIYTYHFYHLMQRAKNIYLIYNNDDSGFDTGEKSRFITQLEVEKQVNHQLDIQVINAVMPEVISPKKQIPKSELVMHRLQEIAEKGFSPSALTAYIRNPIDYYFQYILRSKQLDEVEENIAVNTLGTIIHKTLEALFEPYIGVFLSESHIQNCFQLMNAEVLKQFKEIYKEGEIKKGKNLLAFEVAKRHIFNYLTLELQNVKAGDAIKILFLEKRFERIITHKSLPFSIKMGGSVDRIEQRNGTIRIIDYKTGNVEKKNLTLKTWDGLTNDIKNDKIIQLLAYSYLFENQANNLPIEAGILSFKNLKSGFLPFCFKIEKNEKTQIDSEIMQQYEAQIMLLLCEIFDQNCPFEEK